MTEEEKNTAPEQETVQEDVKKENNKKHNKRKELEVLQDEVAHLTDQLLRKQAEFENYKKRVNEERANDRKYALYDFLLQSIETLDIFDAAVNVKTDDEKLAKYLSGFAMINNRLKQILEGYGVKQIECLNKEFDPYYESAMETVEDDNLPDNTVTSVIMRGYMYKERVLRPAMVKVSKKPVTKEEVVEENNTTEENNENKEN